MFASRVAFSCFVLFVLIWEFASARRYKHCSEGCCPHEYCAYNKICYPKSHCRFGCPDGTCEDKLCMPFKPCHKITYCGMAHHCTMNFNLGYYTCQYNLDMGSTVCVDRYGKSLMKVP